MLTQVDTLTFPVRRDICIHGAPCKAGRQEEKAAVGIVPILMLCYF